MLSHVAQKLCLGLDLYGQKHNSDMMTDVSVVVKTIFLRVACPFPYLR